MENTVKKTTSYYLAILCVALSGISFGTIGYFGVRLLETGISTCDLLFWRFIIAALLILPFIGKSGDSTISWRQLLFCFLFGGLFYSFSTFCFFSAVPLIGSGVAMVVFYAFPLLVALLNWIIDKKKLSLVELLAIGMIFPGVWLLSMTQSSSFNTSGILLGVLSAVFYGIYFYASQKTSKNTSPMQASFMVCLGNALFFLVMCMWQPHFYFPSTFNVGLYFFGFSFIGTVLPLWLLFIGLKKVGVTKAALISVFEPLATVLIGVVVLEEQLSQQQMIGMLILLLATIVVQLEIDLGRIFKRTVSVSEE